MENEPPAETEQEPDQPQPERISALKAFRHQMRDNPVIWVMFFGFVALTIPIQMLNPLRPPYNDADAYAAVIATLLVALAFDTRLDITWLVPARSKAQAQMRNEIVSAIALLLLVVISVGLLSALLLHGWTEGDDPVLGVISYLPIAAVAAELFMLMAAFYLKASDPRQEE